MTDDTDERVREEDSFEELTDDARHRTGDPLETLAEGDGADAFDGSTGDSAAARRDAGVSNGRADEFPSPNAGADAPKDDDPFASPDSVFREVDVVDADVDDVWRELADAGSRGSIAEDRERTYADVSKHSFCKGCEHFSTPPEVNCTHEGTDIVAFVDAETVRVVDCPIVEERRLLEEEA